MVNRKKAILAVFAMLAILGLSSYLLSSVQSPFQRSNILTSSGSIRAVGVGVYSDQACTVKLSSISWGMLDPGASQTATAYIRNEGNTALTLSLSTASWNPSNADQYLTLTWDYSGRSIAASEVLKVTFRLAVSPNISGITTFSFDIVIVGTG